MVIGISSLIYLNVLFVIDKRRDTSFLYAYIKKSAVLAVVENPKGWISIAKGVALTGGASIIVGVSQTAIEQYGKHKRVDLIERNKREMHEKTLQVEIDKTKIMWEAKKQMHQETLNSQHRTQTVLGYINGVKEQPPKSK